MQMKMLDDGGLDLQLVVGFLTGKLSHILIRLLFKTIYSLTNNNNRTFNWCKRVLNGDAVLKEYSERNLCPQVDSLGTPNIYCFSK